MKKSVIFKLIAVAVLLTATVSSAQYRGSGYPPRGAAAAVASTFPITATDGNVTITLTGSPSTPIGSLTGVRVSPAVSAFVSVEPKANPFVTLSAANAAGDVASVIAAPSGSYMQVVGASNSANITVHHSFGVKIFTSGAQPTCDSTIRGGMWRILGGAGVADTFEICRKDAADAYAWVTLF